MARQVEKMQFGAQTDKVLKMMIHSVYTNKEVFFRELISNALDAIAKRKFFSLSDEKMLIGEEGYSVLIELNKKNGTVSIQDNGIGMTKEEMIENLGTIARSGTEEFFTNLTKSRDGSLIGQFGIGFYSGFMVANKITVLSKKVGSNEAWEWESTGENGFTITQCYEVCKEGTKVILHIKKEEEEFLDRLRLLYIAESFFKHSQVSIKIVEGSEVEELKAKQALWNCDKKHVSEAEYYSLYKSLTHLPDKPSVIIHYNPEGSLEFSSILFIPSSTPIGIFSPDRTGKVKLYIKGVFINEGQIEVLPAFFRFVYGAVECDSLPLNVSREALQSDKAIKKIGDILAKKVLSEISKLRQNDKEKFAIFWSNLGLVWKEGLCEATPYRDEVLENTLFYTTHCQSEPTTLGDYVSRMREGQKEIYYCCGDGISGALSSPDIEFCLKNNIEVLLLGDPVDGFWTTVVTSFKGTPLKSISSVSTTLDFVKPKAETAVDGNKNEEVNKDEMTSIIFKALDGLIKEVVVSNKMTDSPMCLAVPEGAMSISTESFLVQQKQLKKSSLKILEVNPNHPLNKMIVDKVKNESTKEDGIALAKILFQVACVAQGEPLQNNGAFAKELNKVLSSFVI